jgi:predicted DNA-binding ribbon-helix-helix protein
MDGETISGGLIAGRRTRVRLEITSWEALHDVARRKGCSVRTLVAEIERERRKPNLSAAIRNYLVAYYRESAHRALNDARRNRATDRFLH